MTDLRERLATALARRGPLLAALAAEGTDCVRLLHGATEGAPGVAVDRYGPVLLVQTWREPLEPGVVEGLAEVAAAALGGPLVPVWNHRGGSEPYARRWPDAPAEAEGRELGVRYDVRPRHRGRDPLLFLDLRVLRRRVLAEAAGRSVLNLFAYTCGVGVCAAVGGAREVTNVDFAASALAVGEENARRNGLPGERFQTLQADCLPVVRALAGLPLGGRRGRRLPPIPPVTPRAFDLVVLDPPRWATSPYGAVDVVGDYPSLLKPAWLCVADGGALYCTNHVASVDLDDWLDGLRRAAAKAGRPVRELDVLVPEDDFPSPDGRPPLKIARVAP